MTNKIPDFVAYWEFKSICSDNHSDEILKEFQAFNSGS